jgi:hypothetical protein
VARRYSNAQLQKFREYEAKARKLEMLMGGDALQEIRDDFFNLNDDQKVNDFFSTYMQLYGERAREYAIENLSNWKNGTRKLSGQTMERLVSLVPPYLNSEQRFSILTKIIKHNHVDGNIEYIRVDLQDPSDGISKIDKAVLKLNYNDNLANISSEVMDVAKWLYDDDITSARAMIAQATQIENEILKKSAIKEIELLKKTIRNGQIKSASYEAILPAGKINITAYTKSSCYISTSVFGSEHHITYFFKDFRDYYLIKFKAGRKFIIWYYANSSVVEKSMTSMPFTRLITTLSLYVIYIILRINFRMERNERQRIKR